MRLLLSKSFKKPFKDKHRYLVLCGGRGSGKSEFAARKIFYRCLNEGNHRFLVLRKVRKTCGVSVIKVFQVLLRANGIAFEYNKSDHVIRFSAPNGKPNEILFDGLDEPEKIKSIKGLTGMWIEEVTEFTASEFVETDLVLREPGATYKQIILSFNPDQLLAPWLKTRFFDNVDPEALVHVSTIEDNPIASMRADYKRQLSLLTDEALRKIYLFGMWASPKGRIYDWDVQPTPLHVDELFYGLDFGYSVNPSALIKVYRRADEFWLEEVIYQAGLTNQSIALEMRGIGIGKYEQIYADAAEPKSIDEIAEFGFNIRACDKGPDSVRAGIGYLKSQKIHIVQGSANIIKEAGRYNWREDKHGNTLPEPVKFDDHCFVAGTLIETRRGQVPIENIASDDYVFTRGGLRRVLSSGMTMEKSPVVTAYFSNGTKLTGTSNHPIWIDGKGFIPLDTMRYGDIIKTWKNNALSIKERRIEDIQNPHLRLIENIIGQVGIRNLGLDICIGKYGRMLTEKFRAATKSIIGTEIRRTIQSKILNLKNLLCIVRNKFLTGLVTLSTWPLSDHLLWHGTVLQVAGNGTVSMEGKHIRSAFRWQRPVTNVGIHSLTSAGTNQIASARINVNQHGDGQVTRTTKPALAQNVERNLLSINMHRRVSAPVRVLRVTAGRTNRSVYNLTVSDVPEFFANGILVHNCMDAIRYAIMTHMRAAGAVYIGGIKRSVYPE